VASEFQPPVSTSELAIEKLTEAVNKMLIQLQESQPVNSPNNSPPIIPGNPILANTPEPRQQETLQALLALAASLNPPNNSNNQHTYVSIPVEDVPLFAASKQSEEETLGQLLEKKLNQGKEDEKPRRCIIRKKESEEEVDDGTADSDEEYEVEELEDRIYGFSEIDDVETLASTSTLYPLVGAYLPLTQLEGHRRKEISVSLPNVDNLLPLVYYDTDSDSSSEDGWYLSQDFQMLKVEEEGSDSDADDELDEAKW
ncbi:18366_t:CDS:2, partial [Racocetra fulgida]